MKKAFRIPNVILLLFLIYSCKKEKPDLPTIDTTAVTQISYTNAVSGGDVINDGGSSIIARGICWNTTANPTIANNKTIEDGELGSFTSYITQLAPNTLYYLKAYATNSVGTGYGNQITFTTKQIAVPVITTTAITSITQTTATAGGNITEYNGGNIIARGICWSKENNPTISNSKTADGSGTGNFTSNLSALQSGTTYYVRAYATNSAGTSYGNAISFTTLPATVPILTTVNVINITSNSASSGGNITSDGSATILSRGVCWSTTAMPTIENSKTIDQAGLGTFSSSISGLSSGTPYYVRAYAVNSAGIGYGNSIMFTTTTDIQFNPSATYGTLVDIEGNVYRTVVIGTQTWMAENLKTTKLNDGTPINKIIDASWYYYKAQANYCWYNNDENTFKNIYGALYNYSTVNKGNICPIGWQVPTDDDWMTLITNLGGSSIAGGKMKETGIIHWNSPNMGATNESGFTALPSGAREPNGTAYFGSSNSGIWWTRLTIAGGPINCRWVSFDANSITIFNTMNEFGFPIRCIKTD